MDVLDEPMVLSDEEETSQETVSQTTTTATATIVTEAVEVKAPETRPVETAPQVVEDTPILKIEEVIKVKALEEKPVEPIKEEPKKPAYSGLPIDESSRTWMDVPDEPIVLSDEEDKLEERVSQITSTTTTTTVVTRAVEVKVPETKSVEEVTQVVEEKPIKTVEEVQTPETLVEATVEVKTVDDKLLEPTPTSSAVVVTDKVVNKPSKKLEEFKHEATTVEVEISEVKPPVSISSWADIVSDTIEQEKPLKADKLKKKKTKKEKVEALQEDELPIRSDTHKNVTFIDEERKDSTLSSVQVVRKPVPKELDVPKPTVLPGFSWSDI
ncbi:eukaryotic translation initiation factor 4 gamma-like, partial [Rhagoletis pomonella]|uniref:eukaryotic translation initiation factor 4 gamma-like n=1 Tax=Rhagoletis pomonella TaxID=28610 RepID=UPI00177E7060